jgi:hypothetical protein
MTIKEWRELKPGDKVWVKSSYFAFPILGVVKIRDCRKAVWLNLFGDAQFAWRKDDRGRMLMDMAVWHEGESEKTAFDICDGRRCVGCKHLREAEGGRLVCVRIKSEIADELGSCQYWTQRKPMKFSIKHRKHE